MCLKGVWNFFIFLPSSAQSDSVGGLFSINIRPNPTPAHPQKSKELTAPSRTILTSAQQREEVIVVDQVVDEDVYQVQGVPQYNLQFWFVNFSASKAPKTSILDIFQQPFLCRFQNYQICYHLVKFWPRFCRNTNRKSLKKINIFCLLRNQELEHSGSLRNTQEHSRAPTSTHEPSWALISMVPTHCEC